VTAPESPSGAGRFERLRWGLRRSREGILGRIGSLFRGSLKTAGGGSTDAHFWGAVMAANVDLELNTLTGNATLNYSKCAITEALERTGAVSLARSRSWIQLF